MVHFSIPTQNLELVKLKCVLNASCYKPMFYYIRVPYKSDHKNDLMIVVLLTLWWCQCLTAHNWQKWKRVFLTCPCHKIYRGEAVGRKVANILEKLRFMWICGIWGNFVKNWYFVSNCLIADVAISKRPLLIIPKVQLRLRVTRRSATAIAPWLARYPQKLAKIICG